MSALYLTSVEAVGKTALSAGIGTGLLEQGRKVGFMMPVRLSESGGTNGYEDISFIKEALGLTESLAQLCPIQLSRQDLWESLTDEVADFRQRLKKAYATISRGKDAVLMEGLAGLGTDNVSTLACYTIADLLDARVIVVLRYSPTLDPSDLAQIGSKLEERLLGIVINFVPESRIEAVRQDVAASFQEAGIKVLAVLPEVRSLLGLTVSQLAEILGGDIVTCAENTDDIVENIMLGAMSPDSGIDYFSRKENKAAVIRGQRADMQLAALETSTRCLVLTGGSGPLASVAQQAGDKHVPVIVAKQDASGVVTAIEEALASNSFHGPQKLQKLDSMLREHFDFNTLTSELGLKS